MSAQITDLTMKPATREAIRREVDRRVAERIAEIQERDEDDRETLLEIKGAMEDARRMLTRSDPSASEALIYIERALVSVTSLT